MENRTVFQLADVTRRIGDLLLEATRKRFWVRAQLVVGRRGVRAGHFYCELVEVDDAGRQVAKIDAVIWRSTYEPLRRRLVARGIDEPFADNSEICAECSLEYHDVHGLKLHVHDVDPEFGEAEIERNRRTIIERLRTDGLLERNKQTVVPVPALRIGLVTATGSAAHADFVHTLETSDYRFDVVLRTAAMQGPRTGTEIVAAIEALEREAVDVMCIVRGGGSQLDLSSLDDESIARRIATSTVPVFVGLGHEIDFGVLDVVAHSSFKTPTAVATGLVARVAELDDRLAIAVDRLRSSTTRQCDLAERDLVRTRTRLGTESRRSLTVHAESLARRATSLRPDRFDRMLGLAERLLESRERVLRSLAPDAVLNRGYAIVHEAGGRPVRRADELEQGTRIRLTFADGDVTGRVTDEEGVDERIK